MNTQLKSFSTEYHFAKTEIKMADKKKKYLY